MRIGTAGQARQLCRQWFWQHIKGADSFNAPPLSGGKVIDDFADDLYQRCHLFWRALEIIGGEHPERYYLYLGLFTPAQEVGNLLGSALMAKGV